MPSPPEHWHLLEPKIASLDDSAIEALAFAWVDRSVREHFVAALELEKFAAEANRVRALAPIVDAPTALAARTLADELAPILAQRRSDCAGGIVFGVMVAIDAVLPRVDIGFVCMNVIVNARLLDTGRTGRGPSDDEEQLQIKEVDALLRRSQGTDA